MHSKPTLMNILPKDMSKSQSLLWPVPSFFVDKKDGKLHPVQDYHARNNITVKDAAPLPLIPELIDKLHCTRYFTKLDIH